MGELMSITRSGRCDTGTQCMLVCARPFTNRERSLVPATLSAPMEPGQSSRCAGTGLRIPAVTGPSPWGIRKLPRSAIAGPSACSRRWPRRKIRRSDSGRSAALSQAVFPRWRSGPVNRTVRRRERRCRTRRRSGTAKFVAREDLCRRHLCPGWRFRTPRPRVGALRQLQPMRPLLAILRTLRVAEPYCG